MFPRAEPGPRLRPAVLCGPALPSVNLLSQKNNNTRAVSLFLIFYDLLKSVLQHS